jgi:hypothetical protein
MGVSPLPPAMSPTDRRFAISAKESFGRGPFTSRVSPTCGVKRMQEEGP